MSGQRVIARRGFLLGAAGVALAGRVAANGVTAAPAIRAAASLGPLVNIPQTYNNCGPAAVAEVLAYWSVWRTQAQTQAALRVDGPVVGMTMYGVPSYARSVGLRALMGVAGNQTLVKAMVANGFPIVVHQVLSLTDSTGHWRPVQAYDDGRSLYVTSDPYLGAGYQIAYATFEHLWAGRGHDFFVIYPASRQPALNATLAAAGWHKSAAYQRDLALVRVYGYDTSPASAPVGLAGAFHALALAWDEAHLGNAAAARSYLQQALRAGANPVQARWINAGDRLIGRQAPVIRPEPRPRRHLVGP